MDVKVLIIVILALISVGFLIWALVVQSHHDSRAANLVQNPYCLRTGCTNVDGNLPPAYLLEVEQDPQRSGYQRLNWCIVNAPPAQLVRVLESCANGNTFAVGSDEYLLLDAFVNWYPFDYMPNCGNKFTEPVNVADGTAPGITPSSLAKPADNSNPNYINSPCNYTGPNDDAGYYAYACASRYPNQDIVRSIGYQALADIFGPLTSCYGR
jgi:hypothetical protein